MTKPGKQHVYKRAFILFVLAITGMVVVAVVALQVHLSDQEWAGTEINIARRQQAKTAELSTLSLRIAELHANSESAKSLLQELDPTINALTNGYAGLVHGSADFQLDGEHSPEVLQIFRKMDPSFGRLVEASQVVLGSQPGDSLFQEVEIIAIEKDAFNKGMDQVVYQFIQENRDQMRLTSMLYWALGGSILLVLFLSYFFLLRPILRKLSRQNTELRDLNASLENVNRVKSDFLANMSHEIRTPLNGVIGMSELMGKTNLDQQQREFTGTIQRSAENLLVILDDILDYSKLETGKVELDPDTFHLVSCIEEVIDVMKPSAASKRLELMYYVEPDIPQQLVQDEHRLKQVLFNLLGNAIKFTSQGEIELNVQTVSSHGDLHHLQFSIRDTGIGMEREMIPQLFKSFTQEDTSTTRRYGGTGLGLSICKELVGLMGGRIWAESTKGQGATFFFTIVAEKTDPVSELSQRSVQGLKALVVDDNMTNLKILVKQLSNWGLQATPFNSPDLVIEVMDNLDKFDLCVLDMQMPEMDGHQLTRKIREHYSPEQLPIIVLSSIGQNLLQDSDGLFNMYLTKPVKQSRLLKAIQSLSGVSQEAEAMVKLQRGNKALKAPDHDDLRILIAEDNEIQQAVAARNLQLMGYSSQKAFTGNEVLEKMNKHTFDLILMDVHMPELDGLQTTRKIKSLFSDEEAPVIIGLATETERSKVKSWKQQGMDDVISIPLDPDELSQKIKYWFPYNDRS